MSSAISSHGTVLKIGDGVGGFATIAEVLDITGPQFSRNMHDVTPHNDATEQMVAGGVERTGTVTFKINYLPADSTHNESAGLLSKLRNRSLHAWELIFTDSGNMKYGFSGWVQSFTPSAPVDGILTADLTIKISGSITLTP